MPPVGTKTGGCRVGGPELWISDLWVIGDKGDNIYLGLGPHEEVIPYVLI